MAFGLILFIVGYAIFYWGEKHFGHQCRYSLWCLMGFGSVFTKLNIPPGEPFQFQQKAAPPSNVNPANPKAPLTTPGRPPGRVGPPTTVPGR